MSINIKKIDKLMAAGFGLTGKGESFVRRTTTEVKKFNAERYFEAYASLRADEFAQKAESAALRAKTLEWAAAGEADGTIKKRIMNAGKDLWRTIKALIGKLIILVEEFIAKVFSKARPLRKVADKARELEKKVKDLKPNEVNEDLSVKVYSSIAGIPLGTKSQEEQIKALFSLKSELFWASLISDKKNKKAKADFKEVKSTFAGVSKAGRKGVDLDKLQNISPVIKAALTAGVELEAAQAELDIVKKQASRVDSTSYKEVTLKFDGSNAADSLKEVLSNLNIVATLADDKASELDKLNMETKETKLLLNKLKNAPTSVTGNLKANELQIIRTMCSRASTGLNIVRKSTTVKAGVLIKYAGGIIKAAKAVLGNSDKEDDDDDDAIDARAWKK